MKKTIFLISGLVFGVIFLAHFLRLLFGVEVQIGGWMVPRWFSYPAMLFFGVLSLLNWRAAQKN